MRNTYPSGQSPASFEFPTFAALPTDGAIHFRWGIGGNADLHVFQDEFTKPSYAANFAQFAMPYASEVAYSAATSAATATFSWKAVGAGTPTQVMVELEGDYDEFVARTLAVFGPYPANGRLQVPELPPEFAAYAMPDKDRGKVYLGAHAQGLAVTRPVSHKNMLDALSAGRYVYTVDSGN